MKKITKIVLIIAGVFLAGGIVLSGIGVSMGALHSLGAYNAASEIETVDFADQNIDSIEIDLTSDKLEILPAQSDYVSIEYPVWDDHRYKYELEANAGNDNNTLHFYGSVTTSTYRFPMFGISFTDWRPGTVRVYVPSGYNIKAGNVSGKTTVKSITAASLELSSTSGEIEVSEVTTLEPGTVDLSSVSGEIDVENCRFAGSLYANTTTGKVDVENTAIDRQIDISTISGIVQLELPLEPAHQEPEVTTVSGQVEIQPFPAYNGDPLTVSTTSGDISIQRVS